MAKQDTPLATSPEASDRQRRRQEILASLQADSQAILERMADELVDLPQDKAFGQIEYTLRDLAHELAAAAHQTGLEAGKKKATRAPASSAPTAKPTPASSATGPRPG
jgi:hypothetical protein